MQEAGDTSPLEMSQTVTEQFEQTNVLFDQKPLLISREGLRKARNNHRDDRLKKNVDQVTYLNTMFRMTGGKLDRKQRKRAMKATGLSWLQIYKWIFDKKARMNAASLNEYPTSHQYPV